ncbi:hypothetical protein E5676_scaffold455G003210 [Cucumis melo var. makuwa]|uniref:Ty3-gypsy retrotransposon protein n=1 Tax=Cucumis melo var. makuwa TaxID=1194695 RepID=A0A5D3E4M8_CUCMM|nr:hypothetical protein E5676_scaffold455G003210 [Cucumis melo var. makuwa]
MLSLTYNVYKWSNLKLVDKIVEFWSKSLSAGHEGKSYVNLLQPTAPPPPLHPFLFRSRTRPSFVSVSVVVDFTTPAYNHYGRPIFDPPLCLTYWSKTWSSLSFLKGIRELTLKFLGSAAGLFGDSSLYSSSMTVGCSLCAIICNELLTDRHQCPDVLCIVVMLVGYVVNWNCMSMDYKVLMLGKGTARGRPTRDKKDA